MRSPAGDCSFEAGSSRGDVDWACQAVANPNRHVRRLFELITDLARGRSLVAELVRPES